MDNPIALTTRSTTPIFLTPFQNHDIEILPSLLSIPSIAHQLIAIPQPYTKADAEWWINLQLSWNSCLPLQVLRAGDPVTGQMIGAVSLTPKNSEPLLALKNDPTSGPAKAAMKDNECELGYYLHPDWQRKRIMSAAVRALLRWAKEEVGVEKVFVKVVEENLKSRSVVQRLGAFMRSEEEDLWVEWPEVKGGGKRKLLVWRWSGSIA